MPKAPKTPKVKPKVRTSPRDAVFGKPHAQLSVILPADLVAHLKVTASANGETLRILILRALKVAGYPVDDTDIIDRRAEAAQERARLYRQAKGHRNT